MRTNCYNEPNSIVIIVRISLIFISEFLFCVSSSLWRTLLFTRINTLSRHLLSLCLIFCDLQSLHYTHRNCKCTSLTHSYSSFETSFRYMWACERVAHAVVHLYGQFTVSISYSLFFMTRYAWQYFQWWVLRDANIVLRNYELQLFFLRTLELCLPLTLF